MIRCFISQRGPAKNANITPVSMRIYYSNYTYLGLLGFFFVDSLFLKRLGIIVLGILVKQYMTYLQISDDVVASWGLFFIGLVLVYTTVKKDGLSSDRMSHKCGSLTVQIPLFRNITDYNMGLIVLRRKIPLTPVSNLPTRSHKKISTYPSQKPNMNENKQTNLSTDFKSFENEERFTSRRDYESVLGMEYLTLISVVRCGSKFPYYIAPYFETLT